MVNLYRAASLTCEGSLEPYRLDVPFAANFRKI